MSYAISVGLGKAAVEKGAWLDPTALRTLEPRVAPHVLGAILTHGNGVVDSYLFTVLVAEAAQRLGATLCAGAVTGVATTETEQPAALPSEWN